MSGTKTVFVTGCGRGIGLAIVHKFIKKGFRNVAMLDIDEAALNTAARKISSEYNDVNIVQSCGSVADRAQVQKAFDLAISRFKKIDVVISNAAFSERSDSITNTEWNGFLKTVEVTQFGAFHVLQAAARHFKMVAENSPLRSQGRIVVVGSIMGYFASVGTYAYAMSKAAVDHLVRCLAKELAPYKVNVNAVLPGWIDTPGERKFNSEEDIENFGKGIPWKRLGTSEEVGNAVYFLSSSESEYITGSSLVVDGGYMVGLSLPK
jgi:glucose 1-dehydrogenase